MLPSLFVAALVVAAPVPKVTAAELKWRFAKGDTFYVQSRVETASAANVGGGGPQANTSVVAYLYKATVLSADAKGAEVEVEFLDCQSGTAAGGKAVELAGEKGVVGKKATLTLDAANKVTKLTGGVVGGGGIAASLLGEGYLRHNVDDLVRAVPGKTLGNGDTWTGEEEAAGLVEGLVAKRSDRGSVVGIEGGLTKLEVESDHAWSGGKGGPTLDLKGEKGKRTILFDPKAGRVRKVEEAYTLSGSVGFVGGGPGGPGGGQGITLTVTLKATVTVTDEKPK